MEEDRGEERMEGDLGEERIEGEVEEGGSGIGVDE